MKETSYLKNTNQDLEQELNSEKLREYRQYLVDSGVLESMIKFLVNVRESEKLPEDPGQTLTDFYGEFVSEDMKKCQDMQTKSKGLREDNERLQKELQELQVQHEWELYRAACKHLYESIDEAKKGEIDWENIFKRTSEYKKVDIKGKVKKEVYMKCIASLEGENYTVFNQAVSSWEEKPYFTAETKPQYDAIVVNIKKWLEENK